jgi:hypothetical protein
LVAIFDKFIIMAVQELCELLKNVIVKVCSSVSEKLRVSCIKA